MIYQDTAIYEIKNETGEQNIHLYVERKKAEYNAIAYDPTTNRMIDHCHFTEPLFSIDNAAAKALDIMRIKHTDIKRIRRQAKTLDETAEPDIKINILKALADNAYQQNCKPQIIQDILAIIKIL